MRTSQTTTTVRTSDGALLAVTVTGPSDEPDRPLAVLQHGFPDTPSTWRHLVPRLVDAGYRVATPWLRGYHPSTSGDRRPSAATYADDLAAVHAALDGDGRAVLVGHDWGALAAWRASATERWSAVVGLALPPEPALRSLWWSPGQLLRSRYVLFARAPVDSWVHRYRLGPLLDLWERWSPGYDVGTDDLVPLRDALRTREHVAAALAPYRTHLGEVLTGRFPDPDGPVPATPTLYVHGADDGCIDLRFAAEARELLTRANPASAVWIVPGTGHWVHLERPSLVGDAVVSFLERVAGRAVV